MHLDKVPLQAGFPFETWAQRLTGYTGSDIVGIVNDAKRAAVGSEDPVWLAAMNAPPAEAETDDGRLEQALGPRALLRRLHIAGSDFTIPRPNALSVASCSKFASWTAFGSL